MEASVNVKLYSLSFSDIKTYFFAILFIAGNLALPQLCHYIPGGGLTWLPIYFFTLIAAYKYGLKVGLLTAVLSPLLNYFLFEMPALAILPVIISKSVLLASCAAFAAKYTAKVSLISLLLVVVAYQLSGSVIEWAIVQDLFMVKKNLITGIPGMLIQVTAGYVLLKSISKI